MNPMDRILQYAFKSFVDRGDLRVTTPSGLSFTCGDGHGPAVAIRISSPAAVRHLLLDPEMALGECYMDGTLVVEQGGITDLLGLTLRQERERMLPFWGKPQWLVRALFQGLRHNNGKGHARRNVAHHYDLDDRLYSFFLDADQQYSCAYFATPNLSLDEAQLAKKRHIAAKLHVGSGMQVLDIGCGWGGMAMYLARYCGADVTGITLSEHQLAQSCLRAEQAGLADRAKFALQDYRDVTNRFDRIVSVGMFEHVGPAFYDAFFRKCADLLDDGGVMLLHSIGRSEGPNITNPWVEKYIFPGGYIPALSQVLPAIERSGLLVTDIEILRLHYAETLKAWRERFTARKKEVERIYDERFFRMWEFYLAASEMAFRNQAMMVMQLQLTLRQDVIPMTRDYIQREEARLKARETAQPFPAFDPAIDADAKISPASQKEMH